MLVADEAVRERAAIGLQAEAEHDLLETAVEGRINFGDQFHLGLLHCVPAAQVGIPMPSWQLEARLRKCNPDLAFIQHPTDPTKTQIHVMRNGELTSLFPMDRGPAIPEFSIWEARRIKTIDPDFFIGGRCLERADMPKSERIPWTFDAGGNVTGGGEVVFDENVPLPGEIFILAPHHEVVRGWRTVVARLVLERVIRPALAIKEFGCADSPGWQKAVVE